ncbi:MAG: TPM domain-containing protein, partial [Chloroflexota bacterium]|nr:TPM domain-containing protein [Chloroflexota bacterium]
MNGRRRGITAGAAVAAWLLALAAVVSAAAGPPFPEPAPDRLLWDTAELFPGEARRASNQVLRDLRDRSGVTLIVYTQTKPGAVTRQAASEDAAALLDAWDLAGAEAAAILWNLDGGGGQAAVGTAASPSLEARGLDDDRLSSLVEESTTEDLAAGRWLAALTRSTVAVSLALSQVIPAPSGPGGSPIAQPVPTPPPGGFPGSGPAPEAGPPYPDPVDGQVVYDFADVLDPGTEMDAASTIAGIESRTGAEVVVYTQVKPASDSPAKAEQDAIALMDQWGVGRAGFDDGLVILFDMDEPNG